MDHPFRLQTSQARFSRPRTGLQEAEEAAAVGHEGLVELMRLTGMADRFVVVKPGECPRWVVRVRPAWKMGDLPSKKYQPLSIWAAYHSTSLMRCLSRNRHSVAIAPSAKTRRMLS